MKLCQHVRKEREAANVASHRCGSQKLILIGFFVVLCLGIANAESNREDAVDLGKLTPFYRSMQMQGAILGHGLLPIPAYLIANDIDIRYKKNAKLREEIPFVDTFSINRFLGGYKESVLGQFGNLDAGLGKTSLDYVIRDKSGKLQSRPEVLEKHLRPYLSAGYTLDDITLNLENIPWAIAKGGGEEGDFGQRNPPAALDDWHWTIEHFTRDLKVLYGSSGRPNFKIGNEFNTKKSFNGSAEDYFTLYDSSFKALRAEFPTSEIAPGEFAGNGTCRNPSSCVYDVKDFLEHAKTAGLVPGYVPKSLNAFQNLGNVMPAATVRRAVEAFQRLGPVEPEIHQFGLLGQPFGSFTEFGSDQGVRQAAWQFQVLVGLWQHLHPRRLFHWGGISGYPKDNVALLNGTGFLRLMLDRYLGAHMYRLPVVGKRSNGREFVAIAFVSPTRQAIMVASFGGETAEESNPITIELAPNVFNPGDLTGGRYTHLNSDDDVFLAIRADLAEGRNLRPQFLQCQTCSAQPQRMAIDPAKARMTVVANLAKYEAIIKNTLKWKSLSHLAGFHQKDLSLQLNLQQNELLILEYPPDTGAEQSEQHVR